MNIFIRFTITFILMVIFPFFLSAKSCDFPNIDGCSINDDTKVYQLNDENISITADSNLNIGSVFLSKENFNLNMSNSKLSLNRIIPADTKYKLNINLDNSSFTFRNSNSINIEKLTFDNIDASKSSIFTVQGFSNVGIDELISTSGTSILKIKSAVSTVTLKKAGLNKVYLTNGYLRIKEGGVIIDSLFNIDPEDKEDPANPPVTPPVNENGYKDLNKGGSLEIIEKGKLSITDINTAQLHVINGTIDIKGTYNIDLIDNLKNGKDEDEDFEADKDIDKIINIGEHSDGMVSTIKVRDLNLKGKMSIQHTGNITNLNYVKDADGKYTGDAKGELTYEGLKIPDKDGKVKESDQIPSLTLRNTYLDKLILKDGNISILLRDSIINEIENPTKKGFIKIEYVRNMQSNNVTLNKLELISSTYTINNSFNVKNLKLSTNAELILKNLSTPLEFENLEMGSFTKIKVESGTLDIKVSKNLNIYGAMLNVTNLDITGTNDTKATLKIGVDDNLIEGTIKDSFTSGVTASGNIVLNNVDIIAEIQNTSLFNLKSEYSYNFLHADGIISWDDYTKDKENHKTNLPEWFSADFQLIDGDKKLVVNVQRTQDYKTLLSNSNYANDKNTQNIAESLDKMVEKDSIVWHNEVDKVISSIDLKSNINNIGYNLASLKPIDNNVYIHDVHSNAKASLEMLEQNSSYSYLKTKNTDSDILWVRNGFKTGKLNPNKYTEGNNYSSYFAMAGFDIFAVDTSSSYFQIGIAGGFNFSDINARSGKYEISSVGYNVALYSNFITDHFIFSLTSMYMNNIYNSDRYSISNSKTTSSNNVSEILSNIEVATKFSVLDNISSDSSILKILGVNNLFARPSVFYTNGYINGDKVIEKGSSGYNLGSYSTMIHDVGIGLLLYSTNDNVSAENTILEGSYIPYMEVKTFYRAYDVPNTVISFIDMGDDYDINIIGDNKDGLVLKTSLGVDYEKNSHILGLKYSYENGLGNYADHGFYLNYKFLLN